MVQDNLILDPAICDLNWSDDLRALQSYAPLRKGIDVQTSVELEQIKAARRGPNEETLRYLLSKIPPAMDEADAGKPGST